jgi:hypothetical protein
VTSMARDNSRLPPKCSLDSQLPLRFIGWRSADIDVKNGGRLRWLDEQLPKEWAQQERCCRVRKGRTPPDNECNVPIDRAASKFLALMPQWDFLNFVVEQARGYSSFQLIMEAEATDLIEEIGAIIGLRAKTTSLSCAHECHYSIT